jgi:hypothetical protein
MRRWIKHAVVTRAEAMPPGGEGADFHFAQMGGYEPDDGYRSKSAFFAQHLRAHPRLLAYDRYLRQRLHSDEKVLSVASGR